ncbi:hypothetical protein BD779DRAFT_1547212 [Infundibulicybe gibba]|nr:hypothetical protein BD779DRAFT_1547212 [Infundibulicybe gibba]
MNLPPEIIEKIFLELCSSKNVFRLQDDPRLLVTWVCSRWRAIALAMPNLWANIRIPLNSLPPHNYIRAWVSRSAQSPLSVGFHGLARHNMSSANMFDHIVPAIQRCVSLKLCLDEATLNRLFTLPPGSLCALQNISISPAPNQYGDVAKFHPYYRVTAFQQCPQLRQVSFAFAARAVDLAAFNLPWHQLTQLNISSCLLHEYECLKVLRHDLHRLQALSTRPIVVPSLHTLHLRLNDPAGYSIHFVHALHLPCLRSFRSLSLVSRVRSKFEPLLSETMRHLDLARATEDLPAALELVPNLETLKLRDDRLTNLEVLWALGRGAAPCLETLWLSAVQPHYLFDMLEARLVAARADSGIAIPNVSAADLSVGDMNTARLAALRAAGVQVVFRNRSF